MPNPYQSPTDIEDLSQVVICPKCKERTPEKIDTRGTEYGILRLCKTCGNEWSGGTCALGIPDPTAPDPVPGHGMPVEDDMPSVKFTGAPHRAGFYGGEE